MARSGLSTPEIDAARSAAKAAFAAVSPISWGHTADFSRQPPPQTLATHSVLRSDLIDDTWSMAAAASTLGARRVNERALPERQPPSAADKSTDTVARLMACNSSSTPIASVYASTQVAPEDVSNERMASGVFLGGLEAGLQRLRGPPVPPAAADGRGAAQARRLPRAEAQRAD
jgi:hypothetical protein